MKEQVVFMEGRTPRPSAGAALRRRVSSRNGIFRMLGGMAICFGVCIAAGKVALGVTPPQQVAASTKPGMAGNWQGVLNVGRDMRLVLKVTQTPDGGLQSTLYSADPGGMGFPVKSTTLQDSQLRLNVEAFGAKYDGKVSVDGNSIAGTWQQAGQSLPLNFARATPSTEWRLPEAPKKIPSMAAELHPAFEVATIKPSNPDDMSKMFRLDGRQFSATRMSVVDLISFAYGLQAQQVVNGPQWLITDKFDVAGQPDAEGQPSERQLKEMVQKLLADRFRLKFHTSERQLGAYVLEVAKDGPKLTKSNGDPNGPSNMYFTKMGSLVVNNATLKDFTGLMQSAVFDRPVVDHTGIQGRWNFALNWTPDESQFASFGAKVPTPPDAADTPPSIFTGIHEQAGLKLDSAKAEVEVMMVDDIAKPSAN